ncbi:hypothetical protein [Mycolicibacterium palauense]|uniref:hypothetical protein n=1 Tax=Mycolicibacterium palauense TaxID=2034511 RepID=UPI000BFED7F1|nr:hypothetical protein [Mycolicibacterium palauense]
MSAELVFQEPGVIETRQERALRRAEQLHNAFQTAFEVLAEIYRDEDWRYINDGAGRPYAGFTAFVQDQLGCAASNARRYQQGIVGLILPLQELTTPGTRIPVTSSDVARLGVTGARVVIEQAPSALEGIIEPDAQTDALRELIDSVTQRTTDPGFGPITETSTTPTESPLGALVPAAVPDDDTDDHTPSTPASYSFEQPPTDSPPWDEEPATAAPAGQQPTPAEATPTAAPQPAPPVPATEPAAATQVLIDLEAAIAAVMAAGEPTALAEQLSGGPAAALAPKCLASGQRLVRLGQLLRSLT